MDENHEEKHRHRKGIGADLILPAMATAYAAYYVYTIQGYPWEARVNGTFIAIIIWLLVAIMAVRTVVRVRRGEATLKFTGITQPLAKMPVRIAFVVLTGLNIAAMPWLGFTLTVMAFLLSSMWLLGVRSVKPLVTIPLAAGLVGYVFFIVALDTRLPFGPVEWLLQWLF